MKPLVVYLIGSLRNPLIGEVGNELRKYGLDVFEDWFSAGPDADNCLRDYERARGRTYREALKGFAAQHTFQFDKHHLDRADIGIMVMPAGKSCHIELGYLIGQGKPAYILFDQEPDRYDIMHNFATDVFFSVQELITHLEKGI